MTRILTLALLVLSAASTAGAQVTLNPCNSKSIGDVVSAAWRRALLKVAATDLKVDDVLLVGTVERRTAGYTEAVKSFEGLIGAELDAFSKCNLDFAEKLINDQANPLVESAIKSGVESRVPVSVNAPGSNPLTGGLAEKSGATSLASLAADLSNGFFNADSTAVSLNLSALALVALRDTTTYSSIYNYQRHGLARRFSGTVVFGSKVPEKEITGLSSLPDFDKLLDVFVWDVKVRVLGDRDPRSRRWLAESLYMTVPSSVLVSLLGNARNTAQATQDAGIVVSALQSAAAKKHKVFVDRIARSPQASVLVSGTHLTKETGKNKYKFVGMYDQGIGRSDLTANVQYARTDDVRLGADQLFQTKLWTLAGSVTSHFAPGVVAADRTIDLTVGFAAAIFANKAEIPTPVEVKDTWKLTTTLDFPIKGGGKIPFSVIYTNDPNALTKQKYVSGLVGFSYDFSALKELFKNKSG